MKYSDELFNLKQSDLKPDYNYPIYSWLNDNWKVDDEDYQEFKIAMQRKRFDILSNHPVSYDLKVDGKESKFKLSINKDTSIDVDVSLSLFTNDISKFYEDNYQVNTLAEHLLVNMVKDKDTFNFTLSSDKNVDLDIIPLYFNIENSLIKEGLLDTFDREAEDFLLPLNKGLIDGFNHLQDVKGRLETALEKRIKSNDRMTEENPRYIPDEYYEGLTKGEQYAQFVLRDVSSWNKFNEDYPYSEEYKNTLDKDGFHDITKHPDYKIWNDVNKTQIDRADFQYWCCSILDNPLSVEVDRLLFMGLPAKGEAWEHLAGYNKFVDGVSNFHDCLTENFTKNLDKVFQFTLSSHENLQDMFIEKLSEAFVREYVDLDKSENDIDTTIQNVKSLLTDTSYADIMDNYLDYGKNVNLAQLIYDNADELEISFNDKFKTLLNEQVISR